MMREQITHIHLETVSSTNTWAKENYRTFDPKKVTCITASEQTEGRGRFKRKWISPKNANLYATYFFLVEKGLIALGNLAQLMCLSAVKLLQAEGLTPQIKWPNDLLIHGKKVAGVLCETIDLDEHTGIILGIGINVNMPPEFFSLIDQPATSLQNETGSPFSLDSLLLSLDQYFLSDLALFKLNGFTPFYKTYESLLCFKGEAITFHENGKIQTAIFHSLCPDGRLNVLLPSGELKTLSSGEISNA